MYLPVTDCLIGTAGLWPQVDGHLRQVGQRQVNVPEKLDHLDRSNLVGRHVGADNSNRAFERCCAFACCSRSRWLSATSPQGNGHQAIAVRTSGRVNAHLKA
jgi:hypothetical protein